MAAVHPVPPSWKDLGKSASDLLNKDFPPAGNALEVKTRAPNGVAFKVAGLRDAKSAAIAGDLEAKYSDVKNGVTLTQTWTTSNVLKTQVELENQVAKGLKLDIQGHLLPATQGKSAYVTAIYRQPSVHTRALLDVFKGPTFTADAVIGRDGFLLGAESTYSVPSGAVTRYALGLGYAAPTYTVTLHGLANLSVFSASYYHKVSKDVEAGAKAIWDSKSTASQVGLEVGTKCYLDNTAFVKAKINSVGVAALGYTQALRPGVKASFGLAVDTAKLGEASHKVGTSLTFEAYGCGNSGFEPSSASDHDDGDDGAYAVFGLVQHNRNSRGNLNLNDDEDFVVNPRRHHPLSTTTTVPPPPSSSSSAASSSSFIAVVAIISTGGTCC
ncbi:hypothetical protein JCM8115_001393 [Rhodotorula mucilaginosa]